MPFTEQQIHRYSRHILLPEVGSAGQAKLLGARVLVVGAGGLGSPVLMYLGAAGVGTLGVIDADVVEISNLQRQIIHTTPRISVPKVESAAKALAELNPDVKVEAHKARLIPANVMDIVSRYDVVADCTDNFGTRFMLNDACYFAERPLVSAAIAGFDGQLTTYRAYEKGDKPCYRCIFREPPPPACRAQNCTQAGVMGSVCGVLGSLQATEVVKEILGIGESMAGHLLICDTLTMSFRKIAVRKDPACPLCGENPEILDVEDAQAA